MQPWGEVACQKATELPEAGVESGQPSSTFSTEGLRVWRLLLRIALGWLPRLLGRLMERRVVYVYRIEVEVILRMEK